MTNQERLNGALYELHEALATLGVEHFTIKLIDVEDAEKVNPHWRDGPVDKIRQGSNGPVVAYRAMQNGVMFYWPNKYRSELKDPDYARKRQEEAKRRELLRKADEVADAARRAFLADQGIGEDT